MHVYLFPRDSQWTEKYVSENSHALFVFGDNTRGRGMKGQAVIRKCPNAFGIPTKKYPSYASNAYFTDDELTDNCSKIDVSLAVIVANLPRYQVLVLPESGLGTGLAQLPSKAPQTYAYLCKKIEELVVFAKST